MKRFLPFIIIFFITLICTKPYFRRGFFPTHDGEWAIVRLSEMQREVKDGQFPPRWSDYLNHGFGYPLFSFTYPAPFYLGIVCRVFGIGLVDTIKILFVASVFFSGLFMYFLGKELAGSFAGIISSIFYIVAPFRLVNLYVRGSIGESISLALFPLLFLVSLKYVQKPKIIRLILCALVFAFLILSHNVMALVFFPFWIAFLYANVFSYFEDVKIYTFRYFLPMIVLGFGLSAYFFIPAILEKKYIILSVVKLADVSQHFVKLHDYLFSPWSYGVKPSYQLGWAHILAALFGFIGFILSNIIDRKKYLSLTVFIFAVIGLLVFFAHPVSSSFWQLPPLSWFDFPWRLITPLAFFLVLSTIFLSLHKTTKVIGVVLAVLTIILSINFARPLEYFEKPDAYYATNDATTTSMDELMPLWVKDKPKNRYTEKVIAEKADIGKVEYNSRLIKFSVAAKGESLIKINTIYFPGWEFEIDGKKTTPYFSNPQGIIYLKIPSGNHQVIGRFTETTVRMIANIITLSSIGLVIILLLYYLFDKFRVQRI